MIEKLEAIDRAIVLFVNEWNNPFMDELMWWVSARITWLPLYLILLYLAFKHLERRSFLVFLASVLGAVILADQISVHLFKEVFMRYRPSHNAFLTDRLHFYEIRPGEFYKGGMYGFISSHAANYFALATLTSLVLKRYFNRLPLILFAIGVIICFSRLYLGVHYLSDLIVGATVGSLIAWLMYRLVFLKYSIPDKR